MTAVNERLQDDPAVVNRDPYGDGWMIKLRVTDPSALDDLLSPDAYKKLIADA